MSNREHVALLRQGAELWNEWRESHHEVRPDLTRAAIENLDLPKVNLLGANLANARLNGSNLVGANLNKAYLFGVDLSGSDLSEANITWTDVTRAKLRGTKLNNCTVGFTIFGDLDLSEAIGIETLKHHGPSTIGIDTIYRSGGKIPEAFLKGAGVPDEFITFMHSLVASHGGAIQYYSVFISYSARNEDFTERLHSDLQSKGVRCWFAPEDLKIGDQIRPTIDTSIRLHDKLLLVLSEHSVNSQWVEQEVETALARERKEGRTVLFPIRLDDAVMEVDTGWPQYLKNTRNIGNFTGWKDRDSYQKALSRLLRDLKAEEAK